VKSRLEADAGLPALQARPVTRFVDGTGRPVPLHRLMERGLSALDNHVPGSLFRATPGTPGRPPWSRQPLGVCDRLSSWAVPAARNGGPTHGDSGRTGLFRRSISCESS
jgi:hypothetical protein